MNLAFSKWVWGEPVPSHKALQLLCNSCVCETRLADSGAHVGGKASERGDRERRTRRMRWGSERRMREAPRSGCLNEWERRGASSTETGRSSDGGRKKSSGRGAGDGGGGAAGGDPGRVRVFGWCCRGRSSEDGGTQPSREDERGRDLRARHSGGWAGEEPRTWQGDQRCSLGTGDRAYMWPGERERERRTRLH